MTTMARKKTTRKENGPGRSNIWDWPSTFSLHGLLVRRLSWSAVPRASLPSLPSPAIPIIL